MRLRLNLKNIFNPRYQEAVDCEKYGSREKNVQPDYSVRHLSKSKAGIRHWLYLILFTAYSY
jgi:hypothetical protein